MATLEQDNTLANSATFVKKVEAAMLRRINSTWATIQGDSPMLATARAIMADPAAHAAVVARSVVTESAVAARNGAEASVTDTEIQNAVNAVLPRFVR